MYCSGGDALAFMPITQRLMMVEWFSNCTRCKNFQNKCVVVFRFRWCFLKFLDYFQSRVHKLGEDYSLGSQSLHQFSREKIPRTSSLSEVKPPPSTKFQWEQNGFQNCQQFQNCWRDFVKEKFSNCCYKLHFGKASREGFSMIYNIREHQSMKSF